MFFVFVFLIIYLQIQINILIWYYKCIMVMVHYITDRNTHKHTYVHDHSQTNTPSLRFVCHISYRWCVCVCWWVCSCVYSSTITNTMTHIFSRAGLSNFSRNTCIRLSRLKHSSSQSSTTCSRLTSVGTRYTLLPVFECMSRIIEVKEFGSLFLESGLFQSLSKRYLSWVPFYS